jgi:alkanesulfonate monooxygenase SsuD/methylene tetrahydromethanopterin reductase-like flavin-dependent oxidoreductase (luciferase family)
MKFGVFYEIQIPRPHTETSEADAFRQVLEQVEYAEQMGFEYFFSVEHHFLDEYSYCSAPEVLYGALSQRTKKMRIGHGVRLLPFPYNHPVRAAEQAATLDILSGGRVEFGTGRSTSRLELEGFGIPPNEARARWEEGLRIVSGIWQTPRDQKFSWEGRYFKIPPRLVIPRPVQKPHPPLWLSCTGPETHELAGHFGLGLLAFTLLVGPDDLEKRINIYRAALKDAKPVGAFVNGHAATFTLGHCAETYAEAKREAEESILWYVQKAFEYVGSVLQWTEELGGGPALATYEYMRKMMGVDYKQMTYDYLASGDMILSGDPEQCLRQARVYEQAGTEVLLCHLQTYKIPHEKVMQSIGLLGKHVLPHFRN